MTGLTRTYLSLLLLLLVAFGWILLDAAGDDPAARVWCDRPTPALSVSYHEDAEPPVFHPGLRPLVSLDAAHVR